MPVQIPKSLYDDLKNVTLCADYHFVNEVTIFYTISRRLNYRTVSFPLSRSKPIIMEELEKIYQQYNAREFRITDLHADNPRPFTHLRSRRSRTRDRKISTDTKE